MSVGSVASVSESEVNAGYLTPRNVWVFSIAFIWLELLAVYILVFRQLRHIERNPNLPPVLRTFRNIDELGLELKEAARYQKYKAWLIFNRKLYQVAFWTFIILFEFIPLAWTQLDLTQSEFDFTAQFLPLSMRKDISFALWVSFFSVYCIDLPWSYAKMRLDARFNFYKGEWMRYAIDYALFDTFMGTLELTITSGLLRLFNYYTSTWGIILKALFIMMAYASVQFLLLFLVLSVVLSDRKTLAPLPPGHLREKLYEYCQVSEFPKKDIRVMMVPPWAPPNAFCISFFGLFQRIVFFSSIINGFHGREHKALVVRELRGVFAHEVGHWKNFHMEINVVLWLLVGGVLTGLSMGLMAEPVVFAAMGFSQEVMLGGSGGQGQGQTGVGAGGQAQSHAQATLPILPGFIIAQYIIMRVLYRAYDCVWCWIRHWMEYEADLEAAKDSLGGNLKEGLVKLFVMNLSYPSGDGWYTKFYISHPTLMHRLENIDDYIYGHGPRPPPPPPK